MPPLPHSSASNEYNDHHESVQAVDTTILYTTTTSSPSRAHTPKPDDTGSSEQLHINAQAAQEAELIIEPAPLSASPTDTDTNSTMVYDEEKRMQPDDDKDVDRINPLQSTLPNLPDGQRRSSVSPDRATEYCDPTRPASTGAAAYGLSKTRKYVLLSVFCMGVFIDVLGICVFYILNPAVAADLGIKFQAQTWIITAFATPFAAFLLFWGRVSDLYSPTFVFAYGFLVFGTLNLIISFMTNQIAFFVLRGISGVAAAALIPASYRLISAIFTAEELPRAFTVYALCGALGAGIGVPLGGIVELIPSHGQNAGWRWYFRITTIIILPMALWSLKYFPRTKGEEANVSDKWKRLDLIGCMTMLGAILLLILGTTLGASYGFSTAHFLVPFCLSLPLFPLFFWRESRLPASLALIPSSTWSYKNVGLWMILALFTSAWWTCFQIPMIELYINEYGDSSIIAAVRILPAGVASMVSSVLLIVYPKIATKPRISYTCGQLGGMAAYALFIVSKGHTDLDYWRYAFAASFFGSFLNNISMTTVMVGAMTATPPSQAGVVGAIFQTSVQAGSAIALTVQAGLLTIYPGGIHDFRNVAASWYFMIAWGGLNLVAFWVFRRRTPAPKGVVMAAH